MLLRLALVVMIAFMVGTGWALAETEDSDLARAHTAMMMEVSQYSLGTSLAEIPHLTQLFDGPFPLEGPSLSAEYSLYERDLTPPELPWPGAVVQLQWVFYGGELVESRYKVKRLSDDIDTARRQVQRLREVTLNTYGLSESQLSESTVEIVKDDFVLDTNGDLCNDWHAELVLRDINGNCMKMIWEGRVLIMNTCTPDYELVKQENEKREHDRHRARLDLVP